MTEDDDPNDGRPVPIGTFTGDDEPVSSDDPRVKPLPPPIVPDNDDGGITHPKEGGPLPPVGQKLDIRGNVITVGDPNAAAKERGILGSVLIAGLRADDTNFDKAVVGTERKCGNPISGTGNGIRSCSGYGNCHYELATKKGLAG